MLRRALTVALPLATIVIASTGTAAAATRIEQRLESASAQSDLIALVNVYRSKNGLQPVSSNGGLTAAAAWMADDMAAKKYVGHVSSDGRSPTQRMSAFGYPATSMYTGEDLGAGVRDRERGVRRMAGERRAQRGPLESELQRCRRRSRLQPKLYLQVVRGRGLRRAGWDREGRHSPAPANRGRARRPPPRSSVVQAADETVDPEAQAQATQIAFIEGMARLIAHLFAVLHRMGAI